MPRQKEGKGGGGQGKGEVGERESEPELRCLVTEKMGGKKKKKRNYVNLFSFFSEEGKREGKKGGQVGRKEEKLRANFRRLVHVRGRGKEKKSDDFPSFGRGEKEEREGRNIKNPNRGIQKRFLRGKNGKKKKRVMLIFSARERRKGEKRERRLKKRERAQSIGQRAGAQKK